MQLKNNRKASLFSDILMLNMYAFHSHMKHANIVAQASGICFAEEAQVQEVSSQVSFGVSYVEFAANCLTGSAEVGVQHVN
jgi:hypothetical protein